MKRNVLVCGAALMTILSLALSGCGQNEKPDASQGEQSLQKVEVGKRLLNLRSQAR